MPPAAPTGRYRVELGFSHRGDEKLLEARDFRQGLSLVNRPGWLTPAALAVCYAEAAEELLGLKPAPAGRQLREAVLSLQAVAGGLGWLAGIADWQGVDPGPWLVGRERLLAVHEQLTGGRLHDAIVRLGGVAAAPKGLAAAAAELANFKPPAPPVAALAGRAAVPASVAAAAGWQWLTPNGGDAADRVTGYDQWLRRELAELPARLAAIDPSAPVNVQLPKSVRVPVGQAWASRHSATGQNSLWLHSDGGKTPLRVSLVTASSRSLAAIEAASLGRDEAEVCDLLATVPICPGEAER